MARLRLGATHRLTQITTIPTIARGIKVASFAAVFFTLDASKRHIVWYGTCLIVYPSQQEIRRRTVNHYAMETHLEKKYRICCRRHFHPTGDRHFQRRILVDFTTKNGVFTL